MISADELNSSLLDFAKIKTNALVFGDIDLYNLRFNIKTYKGEEDSNLDIFADSFKVDKKKSDSPFVLSSKDVTIYDSHFTLSNENKNENARLLDFNQLNINATYFLIRGP